MSAALSKVALLGATGSVGHLILDRLSALGIGVKAQTRSGLKRRATSSVEEVRFDPHGSTAYADFVAGSDAVIWALGMSRPTATTLFSDGTRALIAAMKARAITRLIVITGVGAGETRGHGGFLYNRIIFPFVTRKMYADKDRQERLIEQSDLDWSILRPAPFASKAPATDLAFYREVPETLQLRAVTRSEVADVVVKTLTQHLYSRQKVFFGHA